jgi:F0F1-type ATP synthase assembly protein I
MFTGRYSTQPEVYDELMRHEMGNDPRTLNIIKEKTMLDNDDKKDNFADQFGRSTRAVSDYLGIGLQIAVSFAFFVFLGYWGDSKLGTSPLLLLAGVLVGMFGMGLVLFNTVKKANRKSDSKP